VARCFEQEEGAEVSPRPRLPKTQWNDDSIRVEVKSAGLADEPSNQEVFEACLGEMGAVRLRLMLGCYGPGTEEKPKPCYRWLLGESATILCRDLEVADWFREQLLAWLKGLNEIRLERVEDEQK
jgi:hypothetical protein